MNTAPSAFWTPLPHLAVISATGADTLDFLHKQFTQDINALAPGHACLAGYCNPQGRLFTIFRVVRVQDNECLLLTPADTLELVLKRLRMFVLRAKVTLTDMRPSLSVLGCVGDIALDTPHIRGQLPALKSKGRLIILEQDHLPTLEKALSSHPQGTPEAWRLQEILAHETHIYAPNLEAFVPQMVNLEEMGGLNFSKGCYPGQEIVARAHYLGRVKRKMYLLSGKGLPPSPGASVMAPECHDPNLGRVVDAQADSSGQFFMLASLQSDNLATASQLLVDDQPIQLVNPIKNA